MRLVRFLVCFVLVQMAFVCAAEPIKVASAHWKEFSEPGGTGVYLNLIKQSFDNHQIEFDVGSFARAKRLFKNKADILVGVYKDDKTLLTNTLYPKYHLDFEFPIVAIYNPRTTKLRHSEDFKSLTVGWYEEYAYGRFVPAHGQSYRFADIEKALDLLESGKLMLWLIIFITWMKGSLKFLKLLSYMVKCLFRWYFKILKKVNG